MEEPEPAVMFKKKNAKSKANIRKRAATPPQDSDSGFTSSEDEQGRLIKRRRNNAGVTASSLQNQNTATATPTAEPSTAAVVAPTNKDDATKTSNWFDEKDGRQSTAAARPILADGNSSDGTYKGAANYQSFIHKNPDRAAKQVGPVKASSNVRTITVTDYAPDVCKDYRITGFCGFGDSCKFLHAREAYAQGWQLDREWEISTKGKNVTGKTVASANSSLTTGQDNDEDDEKLLESIPFACIICKESYKNPIVTRCGHYYCEACALKRYRKDPSCAACGASTNGVFNVAKKLNRLLDKKREREKKKKEEEDAAQAEKD